MKLSDNITLSLSQTIVIAIHAIILTFVVKIILSYQSSAYKINYTYLGFGIAIFYYIVFLLNKLMVIILINESNRMLYENKKRIEERFNN